jgi:outer membrane lipopolysaccharide assembly protein LptE/RlpB
VVTRRHLETLLLSAAALLLTACSFTKLAYSNVGLAYSNATPMLAWMAGDYVDMSGEQKDWVRERLARAFAWHRSQELPEYRRFLERVLAQADDGISVEEARAAQREMRASYYRLVERVIPDVAEFLSQLDAQQVTQLERKFARDNKKFVAESTQASPEERRARRLDKYFEHIEEFTGALSDAQRDIVADSVGGLGEMTDELLADRRYRQSETLALLRSNATREKIAVALKRLLVDTESWRRSDYQRKLRERDQKLFEMVAALSASLSAEQRAHFQRRIRGFVRDITELTASN